ncbi:MAG: hypothetical protein HKK66_10670 [Chlorobiaceae bacterium]|jgi:hypothetical protein|nr:hypothetical protein [Chlorobiaceae bacterium]
MGKSKKKKEIPAGSLRFVVESAAGELKKKKQLSRNQLIVFAAVLLISGEALNDVAV